MNQDTRWKQRFSNFDKSLANLQEALETANPNKLEQQGIIKAFELCYELAWKTLQDYLTEIGFEGTVGPKPVIRQAFEAGIIHDGEAWAQMHQARNESAHIYNEDNARALEAKIRQAFAGLLSHLGEDLRKRL
jgi:nucleotidyltransferase substrate binding protein (TIGR01987 family)